MRAEHPTESTLLAFRRGDLDAAAAATVAEHVGACVACRRRIDGLTADEPGAAPRASRRRTVDESTAAEPERDRPGRGAAAASIDLPPLPDYEIVRRLGGGGMGVVYLARNTLMGRMEVLKVLAQHLVAQPRAMDRFLREIQSAAQLNHRNIVSAYSAIRWDGGLILAMEYVEGQDLADRVEARGPLPVNEACMFAFQAARGLQHAHRAGMVHRDIKPANLILDLVREKGVVKILDFGLAKVTSERPVDGGLTRQGLMLGTPDYIAPEQIRDAQGADIRADIYSLGCTLYALLSGAPPFRGASLYDILQAHHSTDASPLDQIRPDVPTELAAIVAKMMAKDPRHRFQTPAEVGDALGPYFRPGADSGSRPTTPPSPEAAPRRPAAGPPRVPTVVEFGAGRPPAGPSRRVTLVEGDSEVVPRPIRPPAGPPRRMTLVEPEIAEDEPEYEGPGRGDAPTPAWQQPAVLAASGVAVVALIALGVVVATRGNGSGAVGTAASPPPAPAAAAAAPEVVSNPPPVATAAVPAAPVGPATPPAPPAVAPGPPATAVVAPPEPIASAPIEPPAGPGPPAGPPPAADVVPGPDGLVRASYQRVARSPGAYVGKRVAPEEYFYASGLVLLDSPQVPGFGALSVYDRDKLKVSDTRAQSRQGLGIVLDEPLARAFKRYLEGAGVKRTDAPVGKFLPTFEVRRSTLPGTAPWLAVVVAMSIVKQDDEGLLAGKNTGVFKLVRFEGDSTEEGSWLGAEWYDRLDGHREKGRIEAVVQKAAQDAARRQRTELARQKAAAMMGDAMERGRMQQEANNRALQKMNPIKAP